MQPDEILFWVFAPISIASAILMLLQRNAVHAVLFLVVNFFSVAIFYLILGAELLFAVQIIVYAGAILVLFLFVIMLLGVDRDEPLVERIPWQRTAAVVMGLAVAAEVFFAVRAGIGFSRLVPAGFDRAGAGGNPRALGTLLFRSYFLPFEITSILLIVAAVAAVVLSQPRDRTPAPAVPAGTDAEPAPGRAPSPARDPEPAP